MAPSRGSIQVYNQFTKQIISANALTIRQLLEFQHLSLDGQKKIILSSASAAEKAREGNPGALVIGGVATSKAIWLNIGGSKFKTKESNYPPISATFAGKMANMLSTLPGSWSDNKFQELINAVLEQYPGDPLTLQYVTMAKVEILSNVAKAMVAKKQLASEISEITENFRWERYAASNDYSEAKGASNTQLAMRINEIRNAWLPTGIAKKFFYLGGSLASSFLWVWNNYEKFIARLTSDPIWQSMKWPAAVAIAGSIMYGVNAILRHISRTKTNKEKDEAKIRIADAKAALSAERDSIAAREKKAKDAANLEFDNAVKECAVQTMMGIYSLSKQFFPVYLKNKLKSLSANPPDFLAGTEESEKAFALLLADAKSQNLSSLPAIEFSERD